MEKRKMKSMMKKGVREGLFMPLKSPGGLGTYMSEVGESNIFVHSSLVDLVPKSRVTEPLIEIITAMAQEGTPEIAKSISKALPCFHSELYPWAGSMVNYYTKGIYSKVLTDMEKLHDEAHTFTYFNKANLRTQWFSVCEALKHKMTRKLDGHYVMRILPFITCSVIEPAIEGLKDALKTGANFTVADDPAEADFYVSVAVDYYFYCPDLQHAEGNDMDIDGDKAEVVKLFELVIKKHYVLPFWKKIQLHPDQEGTPIICNLPVSTFVSVSGYEDKVKEICENYAVLKTKTTHKDPMATKVKKIKEKSKLLDKMKARK
jgi:hypothetical protein